MSSARGACEPIIAMHAHCRWGPVHRLRDVPGAAWKDYLQKAKEAEVAPIFELLSFEMGRVLQLPLLTVSSGSPSAQPLAGRIPGGVLSASEIEPRLHPGRDSSDCTRQLVLTSLDDAQREPMM